MANIKDYLSAPVATALADQSLNTTDDVVFNTVDGRDVSVDGTKLDGIETGATADQTGAEIKTAYEGEADTNAFTDAEKTKLTGIATGADLTGSTPTFTSVTTNTLNENNPAEGITIDGVLLRDGNVELTQSGKGITGQTGVSLIDIEFANENVAKTLRFFRDTNLSGQTASIVFYDANGTAGEAIRMGTDGTINTKGTIRADNINEFFTNAGVSVNGMEVHNGTGTPEGSITAPVGSIYTRTDGGAGTTLYVKESGTGNTGWAAK